MTNQNRKKEWKKIIGVFSFAIIMAGVLMTATLWQPMDAQGATTYNGYIAGAEKQATAYTILAKVNTARQNASVGALKWDATLESAAVTRAKEIAIYFAHVRPTGAAWYTVCSKVNAENLYVGYQATASAANTGWMNSSSHRANRLNGSYKSYGAAAFQSKDGAVYWVELFSGAASASTVYRGSDVVKTDLAVKMTDGYLSLKSYLTDLSRGSLDADSMRVGGSYYLTLRNWNQGFTYSYTLFSRGYFTSTNTGIATIDSATGKIVAKRAGVVRVYGRTSTASGKILSRLEVVRPQKVTGFTATAKVHAVSMKWNPIAGASGFEIYRATSTSGTYTKVASVSGSTTTYTQSGLTTGSTYYYKVRAYVVKSGSTTRYPGYCATPALVKVL
jgi:uncharacterized protein YkwD